jgi:ATP-dependent helicase HrpA
MQIHYPENLPVTAHRREIMNLLAAHQVIIVEGDTGSGKTTQIPKFCLEFAGPQGRLIGCTQPRRIAAITVAARVSEELGSHGRLVGYKIRFHDETSRDTRIKFMTDGVLLAESRSDPQLRRYQTIIIDEAHERSLNIDFLLGYVKQLLPSRPDLRVIVTSATIDTAAFSRHFDGAPIVRIAGRTYPVIVRYQPREDDLSEEKDGYIEHAVRAITDLHHGEGPGDILAFLPTEKDIRLCCGLLGDQLRQAVVLPIFGRLQAADQKKIFQNFPQRKIVVATNVAETSITVPGIRFVVDTGLARIATYNPRAKTIGLPISRISRAACDQRKGRCGRIGPGVCVRLYAEDDYLGRPEYTLPEIQRANLAEVILQMIALGLGDPATFPFIDPPHRSAIRDGYALLRELGAISDRHHLTGHGRIMADLPIDPCISRIILEARDNNCLREIKIIATALAIQDPRIRPAEKEKDADAAHKLFAHPHSDFLALLNIWNLFHQVQDQVKSWARLKKFCATHYLSFQRMREWLDLHEQLCRLLDQHGGFADNQTEAPYAAIHRAIVAGFLRNIAMKKKERLYQGAGNRELMIFPGSHQFLTGGPWIVAASFLETGRLYALTVATIEPEWLEAIAGPLCTYSWSNPHWQKRSGRVMAEERVALFGLPILAGRRVDFGRRSPKNQAEAQAIFIEAALLTGEILGNYPFLRHNLQLVQDWQDAEHRLRRRDLLCDETTLAQFYAARLPADVFDRSSLNRLLQARRDQSFLMMTEDDIVRRRPEGRDLADFPPTLTVGSYTLPLSYHFEPGADHDGMTISVPVDLAATLPLQAFDWLVPGLLREKTTFLLKGLPKNLRKRLVPLNTAVDAILDDLARRQGPYLPALESSILKLFRFTIRRSDWPSPLPVHLQPRFAIVDASGREIAAGRDPALLAAPLAAGGSHTAPPALAPADRELMDRWQQKTCTVWDFDGLPESLTLQTPGHAIAGHLYPALVPAGNGAVTVTFEANAAQARQLNDAGILLLYRLQFAEHYRSLKSACTSTLSGPSALWLLASYTTRKEAVDGLLTFILRQIFGPLTGTIPTREQFAAVVARVRQEGLYPRGQELCDRIMALLRRRREVQEQLQRLIARDKGGAIFTPDRRAELEAMLAAILPADFLRTMEVPQLDDCDRYLRSLAVRLERLHANPAKDEAKAAQIRPHLEHLAELAQRLPAPLPDELGPLVTTYRNMIEEFRISLFSPEIKTKTVVSAKKLQQQWQAIRQLC